MPARFTRWLKKQFERLFRWFLSLIKKAVLLFLLATILPVLLFRWVDPPGSAFMLQSTLYALWTGEVEYRRYHHWTDWEEISPEAAIAVVAAEDQRFAGHLGFDFDSIHQAWREHQKNGRLRGASTITQQTAKNLFLWPARSWVRKAFEVYFTVLLEVAWPKLRILEVYLNIAQFGPKTYGVGAASDIYFGKAAVALTRQEAALLAAVLPSPARYHVDNPSAYVLKRKAWIAKQIAQLGGVKYLDRL